MEHSADYLVLKGISKSFGHFNALNDINLHIAEGEFVCFLGPSGCGKTTLLRIIAGLETQNQGQIIQKGKDISFVKPVKRDYGIVFQSYALFPNLSIAENIAYGLVNRRQSSSVIKARVTELLQLAGLPDSGDKYPGQLSGGQQQRIALARALAMSPGLLLLDEPLSALDALERVRLRTEIRQLQQRLGVTTIMVTHDQEEALTMADRIVVMNHGVIEQIGTPEQIYLQPRTPFVASFVGKVNVLRATALGAGRFRIGILEFDCPVWGDKFVAGQTVKVYLRPEDIVVHRDQPSQPSSAARPRGTITKMEFLGAYCHACIEVEGLDKQSVTAAIPLSDVHQNDLKAGTKVILELVPAKARIFSVTKEASAVDAEAA
ncbi:putative 2-aminoethylphosphonate ABC transporter ATP-binding protein [Undibacterium sp. SXout11W]|uniref:putative 2-aminoethylphosphonate ABC transporter ATP-binding protein n=1 Tax=Undibacterium sp. SXout11W TaxID=3413050 RepID=UPI003BF2BFD0